MPGMYAEGDYDLAGFAVGAAERDSCCRAPTSRRATSCWACLERLHSNGYSLVRKVVAARRRARLRPQLLEPTRIYVKPLLAAIRGTGAIKGLAHITGGGLPGNVPRCLPDGCARGSTPRMDGAAVFGWLQRVGSVPTDDMLRTFNCGLGMVVVVARATPARRPARWSRRGESVREVGVIERAPTAKPTASSTTPTAYGEAEGRHPDLGPRQQHGRADQGRAKRRLSAEIACVVSNVADARRSVAAQAGIATA
jgi:phosphoribosylformylglycinamidine cyclo-ligase